jgi:glycosyltransferase involved in cell wall biosynthesis
MTDTTQRPLKILHTENTMAWGGQEIRILSEARGMLDRGHQVQLLAAPQSKLLRAAQNMGIPAAAIAIRKKRLGPLLTLRQWLARQAHEFDVINTHGSTDSWLTALACASLGNTPALPPMVRTRHVSTPINNHFTTRWLYRRATAHIVTTGEALRRQLHSDNGYPLEHMTSIRTGIDLRCFHAHDQRAMRLKLGVKDVPTLGVLATLRSWKGHQDLLFALTRLRARFPDWQLLIIGDGPQRFTLETLVDTLELRPAVRFIGNVDNVDEWLSTLDLFTLPSYGDEGVPQSIMQAMACGLAVVSTTVGAIDEAVQDGSTGVLVEPNQPSMLADALGHLMQNSALRMQMGAAGQTYAQAHFGIDTMLDRMEEVFYRYAKTRSN